MELLHSDDGLCVCFVDFLVSSYYSSFNEINSETFNFNTIFLNTFTMIFKISTQFLTNKILVLLKKTKASLPLQRFYPTQLLRCQ